MKDIHVLAIIVRVFAIFLAVNALISGSDLMVSLSNQNGQSIPFSYYMYPIISLFVSLVMFIFPMTVAKGIIPYQKIQTLDLASGSYEHLLTTAVIVLGLYFLFDALIDMFYWVYLWIVYFQTSPVEFVVTLDQKAGTAATVAELFIALFLIFGTRKIVKLLDLNKNKD